MCGLCVDKNVTYNYFCIKNLDIEISNERKLIVNFSVNIESRTMNWAGKIPRLQFAGTYDVGGRVLLLPIKGSGAINITLGE